MTAFYGRETELKHLNSLYASGTFQFTVIYGRRRIGKTSLILKYIEGKNAIYFMALESGGALNLEGMSRVVHRFLGHSENLPAYRNYEDLFLDLASYAKDHSLIFVIDEYPYLAEANPELSSLIQRFCDHEWKTTKLHLILCGSSMSFMETQVLGVKSPLYGRRSSQIKLQAFRFQETSQMLSTFDKESIAVLHVAMGGIPDYLSYIDPKLSVAENLKKLFFDPNGRLFEEPKNLLLQELREPKTYNDILDAIANGSSKHNDIAQKTSLQSGTLSRYLDSLMSLGIIKKLYPLDNHSKRRTIYRIHDGSFRFWYRFVANNISAISLGLGAQVWERQVEPYLSEFMGQGFESIATDLFDEMNQKGELPDLILRRGPWWGTNPSLRQEEEIDLVGLGSQLAVFVEVKWTNAKVPKKVLDDLMRKSLLFRTEQARYYILFSKTGFVDELYQLETQLDNLKLCTFLPSESQ